MRKLLLLLILSLNHPGLSFGQTNKYVIQLKNKAGTPHSLNNPSQFLSPRSVDRKQRHSIPIDSADLPVTARYVDSIRLSGNVTILNVSRWFNQVTVLTSDSVALEKINNFPFVVSSATVARPFETPVKSFPPTDEIYLGRPNTPSNDLLNYGNSGAQVNIHRGSFLHNRNLRGEGMQIAVMDAGFFRYHTLPTFDSIRNNQQILGTWDFVRNESSVQEDHQHGSQCLSIMAANMPGIFIGTAPKSGYYLFRTEDVASEYPIEEQNWLVAAERADSLGIDVISSSLGYSTFSDASYNYSYADMNGNTTISARAADMAAKKGLLVFTSAGNEGDRPWQYIITPADADSVVTVGAVDTSGNVGAFSSFGPSSDGQIKPDVAAVGWNAVTISTSSGMPVIGSGTSFACPNMAGIATCLWQAFPEINNMGIIDLLRRSANKASNPDDRVGYGIPDVKKAFILGIRKLYNRERAEIEGCKAAISIRVKSDSSMYTVIERKLPSTQRFDEIYRRKGSDIFTASDYPFEDDLALEPSGIIEYKIRIELNNDTSFIADSFTIDYFNRCLVYSDEFTVYQPYPTLNAAIVKLATVEAGKADLLIFDAQGRKFIHQSFYHDAGIEEKTISLAALPRGMYFISIIFRGKKVKSSSLIRH